MDRKKENIEINNSNDGKAKAAQELENEIEAEISLQDPIDSTEAEKAIAKHKING